MLVDLSIVVDPAMTKNAKANENKAHFGHLGTHFDIMDKTFPLEYTEREGLALDVSAVRDREIEAGDIALGDVKPGMFVAFYTGFIEAVPYGSETYFKEHPVLAYALLDALLDKQVSIVGVDFAGVRRGKEHPPADQRFAEHNAYIVENLCNLDKVLQGRPKAGFTAQTFPMNFTGMTGVPCRVVAKIAGLKAAV